MATIEQQNQAMEEIETLVTRLRARGFPVLSDTITMQLERLCVGVVNHTTTPERVIEWIEGTSHEVIELLTLINMGRR